MADIPTTQVLVRLPHELLAGVDAARRAEPDIPTRPEMVRRALADWLTTRGFIRPPS